MTATVVSREYIMSTEPWPKDATLYHTNEDNQMLLDELAELESIKALLDMYKLNYKTVTRVNAESMSPDGQVPFLKLGSSIETGFESIASYLQKRLKLSETAVADEELALIQSVVQKIFPKAEKYICWFNDATYSEYTLPRYSKAYPWPVNYFLIWKKKNFIAKEISTGIENKPLDEILKEFDTCCQTLQEQLTSIHSTSGSKFFSRTDKPSELDALVYGHTTAILKSDQLPDDTLLDKINSTDRLIAHYNDIRNYLRAISSSSAK